MLKRRVSDIVVWSLPLLLPVVPAVVSLLLAADPDSDSRDIGWAFVAIPAAAILGARARAVQSARIGGSKSSAWLNALGAAGIGLLIGWYLWWQAVVDTCHGGYECPF